MAAQGVVLVVTVLETMVREGLPEGDIEAKINDVFQ